MENKKEESERIFKMSEAGNILFSAVKIYISQKGIKPIHKICEGLIEEYRFIAKELKAI